MRDLALPLSILVLAGVLALDHLPTAHAQEADGPVLCTMLDRKLGAKKMTEAFAEGLGVHAGREVVVVPMPVNGSTNDVVVCSWPGSER